MIASIVRMRFPQPVGIDEATAVSEAAVPRYRQIPGLLQKFFLTSEDGLSGGGYYVWESKAAAEAWYTPQWRQDYVAKYGVEPEVEMFEIVASVDNRVHR